MEPVSPDKVVWLDATELNNSVARRDEPTVFLGECRDFVIGQITGALHGILEKVERAIFDMADRTDESDLRNQCLDAHDKLGPRRAMVVFGFRRNYLAAWDRVMSVRATSAGHDHRDGDDLTLVDNDSLEETIAIGKLSTSLERHCEEQLFKLSSRVGELLGDPKLDNASNPLRPQLLSEALHASLADLALGTRAKVAVLGLLEPFLRDDLRRLYVTIEQRLARRQSNLQSGAAARRQPRKTFAPGRRENQEDLYGTLARLVSEARGEPKPANPSAAPGTFSAALAPLQTDVPSAPGGTVGPQDPIIVGSGSTVAGTVPTGPHSASPQVAGALPPAAWHPTNAAGSAPSGASGVATDPAAAGAAAASLTPTGTGPSSTQEPAVPPPLTPAAQGGGGLPPDQGHPPVMPLPAAGVGAVSGFPPGETPAAANSATLLHSLTSLQRGDMSAFGAMGALQPGDFETGSNNILHAIRRTPMASQFPPADGITFDIVAMLFDFIFEDEDIPDLMKARIGRLQVPVVKVALLDKAFFSTRQHPARQLIDLLAEAAQSWVPDGFNNDRLLTEVDAVVQGVLDRFESDISVFTEGVTRITVFLEGERARERELAQASAHLVLARERREIGLNISRDAIERRLAGHEAPEAVSSFLRQHWTQVMAELHLRHGEGSTEWSSGLATLDELLWSVEPKLTSPERNQLVARLPQLLRRLQSGMDLAEVVPAERNAFFTGLVACHASAVKMGLRSAQPQADTTARRPAPESIAASMEVPTGQAVAQGLDADGQPAPLLLTRVEENGIQLEEIRLSKERGTRVVPADQEDEYVRMVHELKRGACVEFASLEGQRSRCKLAWVSPLRGIYLFTRQPGRQALSISPEALAAAVRSGEATLLNDSPLFDRAVDSLLGALSPV